MQELDLAYVAPSVGILALIFVWVLAELIKRENPGTDKMRRISSYIEEGAKAFLNREFKTIIYFMIPLGVLLWIFLRWEISLGFLIGSIFSMLAAYIGMMIAVKANVRTANAIVGLDIETSDLGLQAEVIVVSATGTAVIVEPE